MGRPMQDFGVLWVWGSCGDIHRIFCGYGMGMGIEIPSPRQPWLSDSTRKLLRFEITETLIAVLEEKFLVSSFGIIFGTLSSPTGAVARDSQKFRHWLHRPILFLFDFLISELIDRHTHQKCKPIWILLKQESVSGSGISWAICKSAPRSRQITTPAPRRSVFYKPGALPAAQPTASKHWRVDSKLFKLIQLRHHCLNALLPSSRFPDSRCSFKSIISSPCPNLTQLCVEIMITNQRLFQYILFLNLSSLSCVSNFDIVLYLRCGCHLYSLKTWLDLNDL